MAKMAPLAQTAIFDFGGHLRVIPCRPFFVNLQRLYSGSPAQAGYGDKRAS